VWLHNFYQQDGTLRRRTEELGIPFAALFLNSP
jgi:hypothetical protein